MSEKNKLVELDRIEYVKDGKDDPSDGIVHHEEIDTMEGEVQEVGRTPQPTHNAFSTERVNNTVHIDDDSDPSGQVHRDHPRIRYMRSPSPRRNYKSTVSLLETTEMYFTHVVRMLLFERI